MDGAVAAAANGRGAGADGDAVVVCAHDLLGRISNKMDNIMDERQNDLTTKLGIGWQSGR